MRTGRILHETSGGFPQIGGHARFTCQDICRSAGQNGERHARVKHAVRYFIDGSIAARGNNEIAAGLDFAARLKPALRGAVVATRCTAIPSRASAAMACSSRCMFRDRLLATGL